MNDNTTNGDPNVTPQDPSVTVKPGWKTSQGQMTAIFALVCLVLSLFGIKRTPEDLNNYIAVIESLASTIGPLITAAVTLIYYIISRGKTASTAVTANAAIKQAQLNPPALLNEGKLVEGQLAPLVQYQPMGFMDDRFTRIIGGEDWKDPERYGNLVEIAAAVGVPGAAQADKVKDKFKVDEILGAILSQVRKKKDN